MNPRRDEREFVFGDLQTWRDLSITTIHSQRDCFWKRLTTRLNFTRAIPALAASAKISVFPRFVRGMLGVLVVI